VKPNSMKKILITTTESLHGWEIEEYLKPVFASVVIGTNVFSDISASFTDFFGGRSESYERKLQLVKDNAINILTSKALELGANCLLGLKVDMDEISGKNSQMFMITAYATAVIAKNLTSSKSLISVKNVDKSTVTDKATLIKMLKDFSNPKYQLTTGNITLATAYKADEFKDHFFDRLKKQFKSSYEDSATKNKVLKTFLDYFVSLDTTVSKSIFYNGLLVEPDSLVIENLSEVIVQVDLVDYKLILNLLGAEEFFKRKVALKILMGDKPFYTIDDIAELKIVVNKVEKSFPEQALRSMKKSGFLTVEREVWTCECSKTNEAGDMYCSNCYKDIYGFKQDDIKPQTVIDSLTNKVEALQQVFSR
jgi:uncharacterized protein YbjQ (UPF0145 family)